MAKWNINLTTGTMTRTDLDTSFELFDIIEQSMFNDMNDAQKGCFVLGVKTRLANTLAGNEKESTEEKIRMITAVYDRLVEGVYKVKVSRQSAEAKINAAVADTRYNVAKGMIIAMLDNGMDEAEVVEIVTSSGQAPDDVIAKIIEAYNLVEENEED